MEWTIMVNNEYVVAVDDNNNDNNTVTSHCYATNYGTNDNLFVYRYHQ